MFSHPTRITRSPIVTMAAIALLAACTPTASPEPTGSGPTGPVVSSPGQGLGSLPGVEGFTYRAEDGAVPGFVAGANESLDGAAEVSIVQSAIATRGSDQVSLIAFGFPGSTDTVAVDYFARVLDGMEDGFGAGSQPVFDGDAYVMTNNGQSVVLAPWGRTAEHLVFLFALGPSGITEQLAAAILGVEG